MKNTVAESQILKWMKLNQDDEFARTLLYSQILEYYVWNGRDREWNRRKDDRKVIRRVFHVPPSAENMFYIKMLLNHVRGPTCHADIRCVNGVLKESYKEACYAMSLLDDDKEYIE